MSTVTYHHQPGIHATRGAVPLHGTKHLYTVKKVLWPEQVEVCLERLLVPCSLHLCCGKSLLGDVRADLNEPSCHVRLDASVLPFADESFASILCDPPYNGKFQWNHDLLSEMSRVAQYRIIFQHWFIPADSEGRWKKWHKFKLTKLFVWQPRTYFGRVQCISVFDNAEYADDLSEIE